MNRLYIIESITPKNPSANHLVWLFVPYRHGMQPTARLVMRDLPKNYALKGRDLIRDLKDDMKKQVMELLDGQLGMKEMRVTIIRAATGEIEEETWSPEPVQLRLFEDIDL